SHPLPDNRLLTDLFNHLENESVNVDMISQIINLEGLQMSFTIKDTDAIQITRILESLKEKINALDLKINEAYVKLSYFGSGIRDRSVIASIAFMTMNENDIIYYQTTTSEISISCVINSENGERDVQELYETFDI